jgi:hypothetical protein
MNIKLCYLYRDAGNYKQYNEIVFTNPTRLPLEEIKQTILKNLIDGSWFIAKHWNVPDMHFKEYTWDSEIDHEWHEFDSVEATADTPAKDISIEAFLKAIHIHAQ